ncbi:MAG: glycosyltransferase family 1 protein [Flavobacteriales bacterium]|nr:glycosyltransferase family 1 protein [Flavobacteriales bacterium]
MFDRKFDQSFVFAKNITPIVIGPPARHPVLFKIWFNHSVTRALKKIGADIFLSTDGFLSLKTSIPQIAVIHDLNFEHYPEDLPKAYMKYYKKYFPLFAKKAARIITVSEFSKKDISKQYAIPLNKIEVTYNGVGDNFSPSDIPIIESTRMNFSEGSPYLVYVGALHARKNIERMLLAFDQFKKNTNSDYKMLIVGEKIWKNTKFESTLENLRFKNDVIFTGRLTSHDLNKVIGSSNGLVYVSYFEGFGIPIIEAMKCEVPVVTSDVTCMPEIAGNAAILVDPFSVNSISKGMEELLDKEKYAKYIQLGKKRVLSFSWDNSAKIVWSCIEDVLAESN